MRILITGGAGFIGSHIAEFHLNQGDDVFVVDNLSTGFEKNVATFQTHPKFQFSINDLLTWTGLSEQISRADRIYHMAAMVGMYNLLAHPVATIETNVLCCERLLRMMSELNSEARLIVASSSEIYGPSTKPCLSEDDLLLFRSAAHSKWVYASSKFIDEIFSLTYATEKNIKVSIIRLFNTIGPRQNRRYGMVVPRFIAQAVLNQPITVYGTGEQTRSFCDVRDTVEALQLIAKNPLTIGEIINLGQDQPISMNDLATVIKQLAKSKSVIQHIPYQEAYGQAYEDILNRRPDLTKFYQLTGFTHQWNLEKTLQDLIENHH